MISIMLYESDLDEHIVKVEFSNYHGNLMSGLTYTLEDIIKEINVQEEKADDLQYELDDLENKVDDLEDEIERLRELLEKEGIDYNED